MSAFKKLNKQDVFISAYNAKKSWSVTGSLHDDYGIELLPAYTGSKDYYVDTQDLYTTSGNPEGVYPELVYRSIDQLYYRSFKETLGTVSGSIFSASFYDHHLESSFTSASRFLNVSASVFSLPRNIIGTHIEPNSITLIPSSASYDSVFENFVFEEGVFTSGSVAYLDQSGEIYDDGEGNLYVTNANGRLNIGNVIYTHGIAIITNPVVASYYNNQDNGRPLIRWKSNLPIYTYNVHCKVKESEFNFSQNPSITSGSEVITVHSSSYHRPSGNLKDFATGSNFQPYFTSIGLYNDANELIAVAKLGKAVPKSTNSDMTVVVKLDI